MISKYAKYIYEREGKSILEDEQGFATYSFINDVCYIEDIFVLREHRQSGVAAKYANAISADAKLKGAKKLMGSVCITANNSTTSLKVLLAYGFQLHSLNGNMIYLMKNLEV